MIGNNTLTQYIQAPSPQYTGELSEDPVVQGESSQLEPQKEPKRRKTASPQKHLPLSQIEKNIRASWHDHINLRDFRMPQTPSTPEKRGAADWTPGSGFLGASIELTALTKKPKSTRPSAPPHAFKVSRTLELATETRRARTPSNENRKSLQPQDYVFPDTPDQSKPGPQQKEIRTRTPPPLHRLEALTPQQKKPQSQPLPQGIQPADIEDLRRQLAARYSASARQETILSSTGALSQRVLAQTQRPGGRNSVPQELNSAPPDEPAPIINKIEGSNHPSSQSSFVDDGPSQVLSNPVKIITTTTESEYADDPGTTDGFLDTPPPSPPVDATTHCAISAEEMLDTPDAAAESATPARGFEMPTSALDRRGCFSQSIAGPRSGSQEHPRQAQRRRIASTPTALYDRSTESVGTRDLSRRDAPRMGKATTQVRARVSSLPFKPPLKASSSRSGIRSQEHCSEMLSIPGLLKC